MNACRTELCIVTTALLFALLFCQDLHVISTDENRVVAAVQEWNQNETYNLYVSDTLGVYYTLALENVVSSIGPEGNVMVDLYEVRKHHYLGHDLRHTICACIT